LRTIHRNAAHRPFATLLALLGLAFMFSAEAPAQAAAAQRPNIVFILIDDAGIAGVAPSA